LNSSDQLVPFPHHSALGHCCIHEGAQRRGGEHAGEAASRHDQTDILRPPALLLQEDPKKRAEPVADIGHEENERVEGWQGQGNRPGRIGKGGDQTSAPRRCSFIPDRPTRMWARASPRDCRKTALTKCPLRAACQPQPAARLMRQRQKHWDGCD